jgi:hypothetical protein
MEKGREKDGRQRGRERWAEGEREREQLIIIDWNSISG